MAKDEESKELVKVEPKSEVARQGSYNWIGLNPAQIKGVAQAMALSGMFPDIQKDSAKAFVKIMAGQEMGIPPFQAMNDIAIISGKAAAGGNIYAAKVKSNPKYDYHVKNWTSKGCVIEFFQYEDGKKISLGESRFDENDAKAAGLLGKNVWKSYPRNMYFNRAMTAGVRTYCPDALGGVTAYTPEELGANVDEEGSFVSMDDNVPKKAIPAKNTQKEPEMEQKEPEVDESEEDEVPVEPDAVVEPTNEELSAAMDDTLDSVHIDEENDTNPPKPNYGPKTSSGLARPEQRKYYKALLKANDIETPEAVQIARTVVNKDAPTNYDDFEDCINFILTGEIPHQEKLTGDEDE